MFSMHAVGTQAGLPQGFCRGMLFARAAAMCGPDQHQAQQAGAAQLTRRAVCMSPRTKDPHSCKQEGRWGGQAVGCKAGGK